MITIANKNVNNITSPGNTSMYTELGRKKVLNYKPIVSIAKIYDVFGKEITDPKKIEEHFNPVPEPPIEARVTPGRGFWWNFLNSWARPIKNWYTFRKLNKLTSRDLTRNIRSKL